MTDIPFNQLEAKKKNNKKLVINKKNNCKSIRLNLNWLCGVYFFK